MYLDTIKLVNFKNIAEAEVSFSPNINCITGNNGSGKTNLLDAIHYLSMTKSYFSASDIHTYRYGENITAILGHYTKGDGTCEQISISIKRGEDKQVKRGQKVYKKFSEHIGLIPIVMTSPYDTELINDSGDERRRFLNTILSQTDKVYLQYLQNYNQLLHYRNKLLKEDDPNLDFMDTLTLKMAPYASYIFEKRKNLCDRLSICAQGYYEILSGGRESVAISYDSDISQYDFEEMMAENFNRDRILGYTSGGIHRDNLKFTLNGHAIKNCGSQGQQKSFILSLKLAEAELVKGQYGQAPILLLDDIFDKLDTSRVKRLVELVSISGFGQIFITDSNKTRLSELVGGITQDCCFFTVENGAIFKS